MRENNNSKHFLFINYLFTAKTFFMCNYTRIYKILINTNVAVINVTKRPVVSEFYHTCNTMRS